MSSFGEASHNEFFLNGNIGGAFLDAQKLYPQGPITIKISNINEEIGLFRAYDPDDPKSLGNYNFELVSGDGDRSNDNFILTTNGNLKVNANLRSGEHSVRVRVTDVSGMFLERAFTFIKENELHGLVLTPYIPPHFAPPISSNIPPAKSNTSAIVLFLNPGICSIPSNPQRSPISLITYGCSAPT